MSDLALALASALLSTLESRRDLVLENLALRHQLAVLAASERRPRFRPADRLVWTCLRRFWNGWRGALVLIQSATVFRWHREGFRRYWRRKSRQQSGRPRVDPELQSLIRKMANANPLWGAPRVHGELLKLGLDISDTTVSRYMLRSRKPPSQTWRNFLDNHIEPLIGSVRRECLDHVVVLNKRHLHRILAKYFDYYHLTRTHLSLGKDWPRPRPVQPRSDGEIVELPEVGGLHHRYERRAA